MTMRVLRFSITLLASTLLLSPVLPPSAYSQDRGANVALLIANANYQESSSSLPTTISDARALADEFRRQAFDVDLKENLGTSDMRRAVDGFMAKIGNGGSAIFYFGGYGIQAGKQTFLLPVNAQISTEASVRREGINLDATLAEIHRRGARVKIVIIDAARRNPYETRFRTSAIGLAPPEMPSGTLAIYAAAPGKLVTDAKGTTSTLVTELLREMRVPNRQAEEVFNRTRIAVSRASNNEQVPWVATSLTEQYQLGQTHPRPVAPPSVAAAPPAAVPARPPSPAATTAPPAVTAPAGPPITSTPPPAVTARPPAPAIEPAPAPAPAIAAAPPYVAPSPPPVATAPAPTVRADPEDEIRRDYQFADAIGTRRAWDDFLAKHPSGRYADAAREKIARLAPPPPEPKPAQPPPRPQVTVAPMPPTTPQPTPMVEGSDDPAIQELDKRIRQSPNDMAAYYKRGQLYAQHGSFRRAIEDFDVVIRLDPRDAHALNNRCWSRAVVGDLQAALSDCNEAMKIRPRFLEALDSRGFINLKLGKPRDAIKDYDAALQINGRHASSLYGRGLAKTRTGDTTGGNNDIAAAKRIQPDIGDEYATYGLR